MYHVREYRIIGKCVCAEERDKFYIALFIYQPSFSIGNKTGKRKMIL